MTGPAGQLEGPSDQPAAADNVGSLRERAARGVKWSFVGHFGRQGIRLLLVVVLARLIGPENFGIAAQAMVFILFIAVFLEQGLGTTLIQRPALSREILGSVFWLNLLTTIALCALTVAAAPAVAAFFGQPELTDVVRVLAISVFFLGMGVIPRAMLQRQLRFRPLALAEVGGALAGGVAGTVAAVNGGDYWAIVAQAVATDICVTCALVVVAGSRPAAPSWRGVRETLSFSSRVLAYSIVDFGHRNVDNALIGKLLGAAPLALYALAYRSIMIPVVSLVQVANRVALPVYSRLQAERTRLWTYHLLSARLIALVMFPLLTAIVIEAPRAVPLVFGDAWQGAVVPTQWLAVAGMHQSVLSTFGPMLVAVGRPDLQLRYALVTTTVYVTSFVVGLEWGIDGVAAAYAIAGLAITPGTLALAERVTGVRPSEYYRALAPVVIASAGLAAVALAVDRALAAVGAGDPVTIAAAVLGGLGTYVLVLQRIRPGELDDASRFIRAATAG
jgi:O-antigen/teichoic acid export membrane protein